MPLQGFGLGSAASLHIDKLPSPFPVGPRSCATHLRRQAKECAYVSKEHQREREHEEGELHSAHLGEKIDRSIARLEGELLPHKSNVSTPHQNAPRRWRCGPAGGHTGRENGPSLRLVHTPQHPAVKAPPSEASSQALPGVGMHLFVGREEGWAEKAHTHPPQPAAHRPIGPSRWNFAEQFGT